MLYKLPEDERVCSGICTYTFSCECETPLEKPGMALQAYLPLLQRFGYKASAQQICGCGGVLSVLVQEKKEKGFKDKDAQASI